MSTSSTPETTQQRYLLKGDMSQMFAQETFFRECALDFSFDQEGGIPVIIGSDELITRGLGAMWMHRRRVDGWFHHQQEFISRGICTQAQFDRALETA